VSRYHMVAMHRYYFQKAARRARSRHAPKEKSDKWKTAQVMDDIGGEPLAGSALA
jgi:hypothetical protein